MSGMGIHSSGDAVLFFSVVVAVCQRRLNFDPLSPVVSAGHRKIGRPF
jgi:hypothetical protein